ncbi:MAG: envelope biogenesis factor ElyC [Thermodesulfobacteriota bacterium]|nr:envelope biogenesis factor ElyC [Thermodesulfobacteriota bacterium]
MLLFKKIIAPFFFPMPLILLISLTGLFLLWFTRKQKAGKILSSTGICILALLSFDPISNTILAPLEHQYNMYMHRNSGEDSQPGSPYRVKLIVILGSGHMSDPKIPITSQIDTSSLVRLIEGIRIYRENPGSKLILSGGSTFDPVPVAKVMAKVAKAIGVDGDDIIIESESRDTKDQALLLKSMVEESQFVLVTSASHMPRAMALFKKHGMEPIPAPTRHFVLKKPRLNPGLFFPDAGSLGKAERAFYEYLGIIWAKLRGQI